MHHLLLVQQLLLQFLHFLGLLVDLIILEARKEDIEVNQSVS